MNLIERRYKPTAKSTQKGIGTITVIRVELEELLGVCAVVGGEGGGAHVPQRHYAVVGAAEEPGGFAAVEHQTVHRDVLLVDRSPLVVTHLHTTVNIREEE
jgi:hypothetical protein